MIPRFKNLILLLIVIFMFGCSFKNSSPSETSVNEKAVPNTPKPVNNAVSQSLVLNFSWSSESANSYDFYLDTKNPPQIIYAKDAVQLPILITGLDYSTVYYWKVVAKYSDGTSVEGPVWKFTTLDQSSSGGTVGNGYAMFLESIQTSLPNIVKVLFQVKDLNGNGVTDLKVDNYLVYEDSQPLSPTESSLQISNAAGVPFRIKTVLMLDNSTSLQNSIDQIRNAAATLFNNMLPNQEFAVYQFSDKIEMLADFTSDKNLLNTAINNYTLGTESTDLYGAVITGTSLWTDNFSEDQILQGTMVLITDGEDTQGSSTLAEAVNAVYNKIVFSIGLGDEIKPEILDRIGTAGYYQTSEIDKIENQFSTIQQRIIDLSNSFYLLTYKSPKRGNDEHIITISIKDNPHTGDYSFISGSFSSAGFTSAKMSTN